MLLTTVASSGCGTTSGQTLDDVLRGLRSAALSKKTYNAIRHADDLEATDKAVLNAFCNVARELADNGGTLSEQKYFETVETRAELELGVVASTPVKAAVGRLRAFYDLASINGGVANLYARACFR
jgi:hypothetical protein